MMTGVNLVHVPYNRAPASTDLLGGQVQVMFDALPASIEYIRTGKLRALAVTTAMRSTKKLQRDCPGVSRWRAGVAMVPTVTMMSGFRPTNSCASAGIRLMSSPCHRRSIRTLRRSVQPTGEGGPMSAYRIR
jgi:hypothetical protein